mmetsp:Transcript_29172/g.64481  ORF Transcript_29172/g.64481 Transcript_29172/m.64481 type:complete len:218 (-) Transcript_29172:686-1339(-)
MRWQIRNHQAARPDLAACAHHDRPQQRGACTQQHSVAYSRVANIVAGSRAAQGHVVQHGHIVAHDGSFANHDTCGVVKQDADTELRCWVDVDVEDLGGTAGQCQSQGPAPVAPQPVAHPVALYRLESLEVQHALHKLLAGGVPVLDSKHVCHCSVHNARVIIIRVLAQLHDLHCPQRRAIGHLVGQQEAQCLLKAVVAQHSAVEEGGQGGLRGRVLL